MTMQSKEQGSSDSAEIGNSTSKKDQSSCCILNSLDRIAKSFEQSISCIVSHCPA